MGIRLVTDSTADLPHDLVERWGIRVVPLYVNFGKKTEDSPASTGDIETLKDGVDIGPAEFYQRLTESVILPTTSQPTVQDFLQVYHELSEGGDDVISIHISSKLSGTVNSAVQAQKSLKDTTRVEVVGTSQASMAVGLAVLAGANAVHAGADYDAVLEQVHKAAEESRIYFMVDTLEYLQKGGRIGKAQAYLGSLLGIKPILTCREGEVHPLERVRTRNRAIQRLAQIVEDLAPVAELCVMHNTTPQEAEALRERLGSLLPQEKILISRVGPIIGTHIGPGAIGIAVRPAS